MDKETRAGIRTLIELGADVNRHDGYGQTPLELAVRTCVDSHWTDRRAPDSVAALLECRSGRFHYPVAYRIFG